MVQQLVCEQLRSDFPIFVLRWQVVLSLLCLSPWANDLSGGLIERITVIEEHQINGTFRNSQELALYLYYTVCENLERKEVIRMKSYKTRRQLKLSHVFEVNDSLISDISRVESAPYHPLCLAVIFSFVPHSNVCLW